MPNRIIKESAFTSDKVAQLTDFEFRLWVGMITQADDAGRGDARPAILKGRIFALRERTAVKDIESALLALAAAGCVSLYKVSGKPYFQFPNWSAHQRIRDCKPKYPGIEERDEEDVCDNPPQLAATCGELPPKSNPIQYESNTNPNPNTKGHASARARFVKPGVEEVAAYCREKGYGIDAQHFVDYYDSNGWKVGKNPMQDWKATVRSWARRDGKDKQPTAVGVAKPSAVAMAAIQRMLEEEG